MGKPALVRPEVSPSKRWELIVNLAACLIGMEACCGARHGMREVAKFSHTVRLIAPKFIALYCIEVIGARTTQLMPPSAKLSLVLTCVSVHLPNIGKGLLSCDLESCDSRC